MANKKTQILFSSQKSEGRPMNVYKEHTSEGDFLWYTTEDGREVGRTRLEEVHEQTKVKRLIGYEYDVEFSKAAVAEVQKKAFPRTQYIHKDGQTRQLVKPEEF